MPQLATSDFSDKAKGRETPADVFKAVKTVTPLYFHAGSNEKELKQEHQAAYREALKALPDRHPDAGEYGVLRVIAAFPLPLEPTKEKVGEDLWDTAKHGPLAMLNTDLLINLTKDLNPSHILTSWRDGKKWPWDMPDHNILQGRKRKEPDEPDTSDTEIGGDRKRARTDEGL